MTSSLRDQVAALKSADEPQVPRPEFRKASLPERTNKYAGTCTNCHQRVDAGKGLMRRKGSAWVLRHTDCAEAEEIAYAISSIPSPAVPHPGIYTVQHEDGGHTTFRVRINPENSSFAPGQTVLQLLTGPDNTAAYRSVGWFKNGRFDIFRKWRPMKGDEISRWILAAQTLIAEPESVLTAKHCFRCGRLLTTPESIENGIGPECAKM